MTKQANDTQATQRFHNLADSILLKMVESPGMVQRLESMGGPGQHFDFDDVVNLASTLAVVHINESSQYFLGEEEAPTWYRMDSNA